MNVPRIFLAALAAFVAYFAIGFLFFAAGPLREEFKKFPAIYRPQEAMRPVMPVGMAGMFVSMLALAVLFSMMTRGRGLAEGALFGTLIGLFCVGAFVLHNYVNLNIGLQLTIGQAIAYFIEWLVVGIVIGAVYRPLA